MKEFNEIADEIKNDAVDDALRLREENKQLKKLRNSALRQVEEMQDAQVEIVNKLQEENRHLKILHEDSCKKLGDSLNKIFLQKMDFIKELEIISEKLNQYKCGKHKLLQDYIKERINRLKGDEK